MEGFGIVLTTGVDFGYTIDDLSKWNSTSPISDGYALIVDGDFDAFTIAHDVFVDGVVNDFFHQHVDAIVGGGAIAQFTNVHPWAQADVLFPVQTSDFVFGIPCHFAHKYNISVWKVMAMPEFFTSLTYFRNMKFQGLIWAMLLVVGCTSKIDRDLEKVKDYQAMIVPKVQWEKIPDSAHVALMTFAKAHPEYKHSSDFVYVCTKLVERQGMNFKAAEYSEYYIEQFKPLGKPLMEMLVVAAHYYEQGGVMDKALKYYQRLAKEFANEEVGKQAVVMIDMISLGLTTPAAQMEYVMKKAAQRDSLSKSH